MAREEFMQIDEAPFGDLVILREIFTSTLFLEHADDLPKIEKKHNLDNQSIHLVLKGLGLDEEICTMIHKMWFAYNGSLLYRTDKETRFSDSLRKVAIFFSGCQTGVEREQSQVATFKDLIALREIFTSTLFLEHADDLPWIEKKHNLDCQKIYAVLNDLGLHEDICIMIHKMWFAYNGSLKYRKDKETRFSDSLRRVTDSFSYCRSKRKISQN